VQRWVASRPKQRYLHSSHALFWSRLGASMQRYEAPSHTARLTDKKG
jgi:hypothetical protein